MKKIDYSEVISKTAFEFVERLAKQLNEKHSYHDSYANSDRFYSKYQDIFNRTWDLLEIQLDELGYANKYNSNDEVKPE